MLISCYEFRQESDGISFPYTAVIFSPDIRTPWLKSNSIQSNPSTALQSRFLPFEILIILILNSSNSSTSAPHHPREDHLTSDQNIDSFSMSIDLRLLIRLETFSGACLVLGWWLDQCR